MKTRIRPLPPSPRTAPPSATTTKAPKATAGPTWTPTAVGTTCPVRDRSGSPTWQSTMHLLIPTVTEPGSTIQASDTSGRQLIPGVGHRIAAAVGPISAASAGAGRPAQAAEASVGASSAAAAWSTSESAPAAIARFAFPLPAAARCIHCSPSALRIRVSRRRSASTPSSAARARSRELPLLPSNRWAAV